MKRVFALTVLLALCLPSWALAASYATTTPAAGAPSKEVVQYVTATGANTVPCPADVVDITLIGGGGQGGGGLNNASFGGGGGGGSGMPYRVKYYCVPGEALTITIGTGGSAAGLGATPSAGSNGVDTTLTGSSLMPATFTAVRGIGGAIGNTAGSVGGNCGSNTVSGSMASAASAAAGNSVFNGTPWGGEFVPTRVCSSGSGGGGTATGPGSGISFQNDAFYKVAATNGSGGTGGCNYLFCDLLNVGGVGTGTGGVGIAASAKCYGCGGGGGGGSNGASGNGGAGMSGIAILRYLR